MSEKTVTHENVEAAVSPVRRNVERLHATATHDREQLMKVLERVAALERTVAMDRAIIQQLQQQIATLMALVHSRS